MGIVGPLGSTARAMADANALAVLPNGPTIPKGAQVEILLL